MLKTTKAPMPVVLPFTTVQSVTRTLRAQQALPRSSRLLFSLSRRMMPPRGKDSTEALDTERLCWEEEPW